MGLLNRIAISNGNKARKNEATRLLDKGDQSKLRDWWEQMKTEREIKALEREVKRLSR